jgi:ABC-2 type transport system permease protein
VITAYRWELVKLLAQVKTRIALGLCLLGPFLFVAGFELQTTIPRDTLFGRWIEDSGLSIPLIILGFAGQWVLPALTSVVAGDLFSSEDRYGTWRTILTRSRSRGEIFGGKALTAITFAVVATLVLGACSWLAGILLIGRQPLVSLSGTLLSPGEATGRIALSWLTVLLPVLGITALAMLFSLLTKSGAVGIGVPVVLGLAMQLLTMVDLPAAVRMLFLGGPFVAWHGLLTAEPFYGPLLEGAVTSLVYFVAGLAAVYVLFQRRDVTGS